MQVTWSRPKIIAAADGRGVVGHAGTRLLADGGETIADLAVLRNQAELFGAVASDPTAWRLLSDLDDTALTRLREARAHARELAWAQAIETRGKLPTSTAAGQ